jgi:glycerol-3-phosphate acyltransferase PlsY
MRTLGPCPAILTIIADTSKGLLAVGLGGFLIGTPAAQVLAGLAVIIGHIYPLFLRGGGRGVATSLAAPAALSPYPAAFVGVVLLAVLLASHYASLASLAGAVFMPLTLLAWTVFGHSTVWYLLYGVGACALVIWAHRDNIGRLWLGIERKVGEKAKASQAAI